MVLPLMTSTSEGSAFLSCDCGDTGFRTVPRDEALCRVQKLLKGNRDTPLMVGVVLVEINQYQRILGSYGYRFAATLSTLMQARLTEKLPNKVTVLPLSLSEFVVLLPDLKIRQQLGLAINKIQQSVFPLFSVLDSSFRVNVTIGASYSVDRTIDTAELMRLADSALLHAHDARLMQCIHDEIPSEQDAFPFLELQLDLERALEQNEITSVFQPKVEMRTGRVVGVESLVRWTSPVFGPVRPDLIIATAERSGLINSLTFQTLNNAILQYQRWGNDAVPIAVNLSTEVINDPALMRFISRRNIWGMPVEALTLEITETAFMENPDKAMEVFSEFNKMGIKLSMDDFGTGYSSFEYLKNIPIQEIKIDRAFVDNMRHEQKDRLIVETVAELAKGFGLRVTAEGVEDVETYHLAMDAGCDVVQGYFISRPQQPDELVAWLHQEAWYRP